ncbi:MAG TPA: YebC/PmpR family DNA-binding transcriptional regulator, partial [candidate division Zixibacteria bacterium]|nr:YebC/PmpR family DNA-binding transcriptional regulator [candidate division Zixibacteria bacterium]
MSGHSKWSTIKRKKAKTDAARGKIFTKLIKEITVAARDGGGDDESNPRLRTAVLAAKAQNMPADNIKRAIQKGTGELEGATYEEITYEGYGPGGVAVFVECLTDNKQRTVAEVRHAFTKHGGNLGENGCVAFIFEKQGLIQVPAAGVDEDALMEDALEAGAENFEPADDMFSITTSVSDLHTVRQALDDKGYTIDSAEMIRNPSTSVELDEETAGKFMKFYETLEDLDDVQKTWANFD